MSNWRAIKTTGTNDIPLGSKRRFGAAPADDMTPPQLAALSPRDFPSNRHYDSDSRDRRHSEDRPSSTPGKS